MIPMAPGFFKPANAFTYDPDCVLCIDGSGTVDSSTFADLSQYTWNVGGSDSNVKYSTAYAKFGTTSIVVPSNKSISLNEPPTEFVWDGEFTWEFWALSTDYPTPSGGTGTNFRFLSDQATANGWGYGGPDTGALAQAMGLVQEGVGWNKLTANGDGFLPLNTWHHFAAVRRWTGSVYEINFYKGGSTYGTTLFDGFADFPTTIQNSSTDCYLFWSPGITVYCGGAKLTKRALYTTATFAVPTTPFTPYII